MRNKPALRDLSYRPQPASSLAYGTGLTRDRHIEEQCTSSDLQVLVDHMPAGLGVSPEPRKMFAIPAHPRSLRKSGACCRKTRARIDLSPQLPGVDGRGRARVPLYLPATRDNRRGTLYALFASALIPRRGSTSRSRCVCGRKAFLQNLMTMISVLRVCRGPGRSGRHEAPAVWGGGSWR